MTQHFINFNRHKARRFKEAYEHAVNQGVEVFAFEGADFLVSYAKHVVEYLKARGLLNVRENYSGVVRPERADDPDTAGD